MRPPKHTTPGPLYLLERRNGFADIVKRRAVDLAEHPPVIRPQPEREFSILWVRSYVAVALFGLAGLLAVFGPVHGTSRQAFYALIVHKLPICVALKRLFPALMADEGRGYVV